MGFLDIFKHIIHILGIASGNDTVPATTALTTAGHYTYSSTPMIIDTSSFKPFTTISPPSISPKFLSSLTTGESYETTVGHSGISSISTKKEHNPSKTTEHPSSTDASSLGSTSTWTSSSGPTTINPTTGDTTTTDDTSKTTGGSTVTDDTSKTTGGSTATGDTSKTTGTGPTGTSPTGTGSTGTSPTGTGPTGTSPTGTGSTGTSHTGTGPTGTSPTGTGHTGTSPTGTGHTGTNPTGTEPTGTGSTGTATGSTDVPPTDKPSLTRGAVAGIVIGSLLAVAIVTAAIVFVVKQRNADPEAQRLTV